MPDVDLPLPFEAYTGEKPFVFASYAHKDGRLVFPELRALHEKGLRIWYDEGIDPGNEWPEEIANALQRASFFIVFISRAAVESRNVKKEINFALNEGKPLLAIHIEDTKLPPGLAFQIGDIQANHEAEDDGRALRQKARLVPPGFGLRRSPEAQANDFALRDRRRPDPSTAGAWRVEAHPASGH